MDIANELVTLIALYPILHPHLIALISAIYCLPPATSRRLEYLEFFSQDLDSFNYSNYESLFHEDPLNISYHEAINGFYARLLSAVGDWQVPEEVIVGIRDALFIVSGAMEKEPTMHENPDIDVPPAAMYMIHASKLFYEESKKGTCRNSAPESPLWSVRGDLWDGGCGLSVGRWKFWKTGFEFYAANLNLQEETRYLAGMAVNTMDEVDQKEL